MKSDLILLGNTDTTTLEQLAKEAGFASFAGGVMDKVAPQFTSEFARPFYQGVKTQWNSGDRSFDGLLSGGAKGIEANRFNTSGLGQKLDNYGVSVNKDMHGRPQYDNPIDFGKTLSNAGNSIWNGLSSFTDKMPWLKNIGSSLMGSLGQQSQAAPAPAVPKDLGFSAPTAYSKYANFSLLAGNLPLQQFPGQLASFLNPPPQQHEAQKTIDPNFNISSDNAKLKRLVDDPKTRSYILRLLHTP